MSVNRSLEPNISPVTKIDLLDISASHIGHVPFYVLSGGKQPVVHLQLIFKAGRWAETKPLQSFFTATQLLEGTSKKSSQRVAEIIDFHGASLHVSASYDVAIIELVCLHKHLSPMLDLMMECLLEPAFDLKELEVKQQIVKQKLAVNLQKTDYVAQRTFHEKAFGASHPYGYSSSAKLYEEVTTDDLQNFHQQNYLNATPIVILSGDCGEQEQQLVKSAIARLNSGGEQKQREFALQTQYGNTYTPFSEAKQTSIRIGKPTISLGNEEYGRLILANAILGGYFGSRLMSNLRESKGLTYGVYSQLGSFVNQGYWFVGTDVGKDNRELAVQEIKAEIQRMQQELVSEDELELVRNYVMGKYLGKVDGPFAQARIYKTLLVNQQSVQDFQHRIHQIQSTTADEIRNLAQQYWNLDEMIEVLVG